jgi:hypothetical protein
MRAPSDDRVIYRVTYRATWRGWGHTTQCQSSSGQLAVGMLRKQQSDDSESGDALYNESHSNRVAHVTKRHTLAAAFLPVALQATCSALREVARVNAIAS